ncbi:competence damage-inducible protein [Rutstroemia sp. NJR-2017a BVV2]|nr:competence damage-inducible protein [Rutstroemia sp. NJR-2017a BVV2]
MSGAQEFPPQKVRDVVVEVAKLLKERGETVSVAETISTFVDCGVSLKEGLVVVMSDFVLLRNLMRSWGKAKFRDSDGWRRKEVRKKQAAGGIISASILSTPGASGIYKGGLTLYTLESRIAFVGLSFPFIKPLLACSSEERLRYCINATQRDGPPPPSKPTAAPPRKSSRAWQSTSERNSGARTRYARAGPRAPRVERRGTGRPLAVATAKGCYTKEVETGLGGDREANMVAFAVEALGFLREVVRGDGKL